MTNLQVRQPVRVLLRAMRLLLALFVGFMAGQILDVPLIYTL